MKTIQHINKKHRELCLNFADKIPITHSDQSVGGIHLATGDWWEPQRLFQVGINDMDGDGVLDNLDPNPGDPAVPWTGKLMGSTCANEMRICNNKIYIL